MPAEELIIADSSPLIGLARIGKLWLLRELARRVMAPSAVLEEVTLARGRAPGAAEVAAQTWIEMAEADPVLAEPLFVFLGRGEAEAIALAQMHPSAILLMDDLRARKQAERLGLSRMGTVALLVRAKREGLIRAVKPEFEALLSNGIYLRRELMEAALKEAKE